MNTYRFFGAGMLHVFEFASDAAALSSARFITERHDVAVFRRNDKNVWVRIAH